MRNLQSSGLQTASRKQLQADFIVLKKAESTIKAINHTLRMQIIRLLYEKQELNVSEIYTKLKLEQSVTSQHLAVLRKAGIVTTERIGRCIYYSANQKRINEIVNVSRNLV